ncbi:sporulation integral membrane protein YtvI [Sporolactobacillus terrae]|uniref:Sporulation integral membrane protein YtvI n=1 Tax=Sporolactobacillus terrae TaxID=269673 RepID=A0A410DA92_9BACL|nr:sporulation integral membrane protein YtvI [Sporolactobacillus terrae]QAA23009.1 sporulation integral membrane protein YtvI [Sporolactobacillus terrae]QAA25982.1 sporulation integral membrane protein YtvI [Sporolactobacillus terrae]UAK15079.1 sporulation integral membrane protein YtvI [Sporolactobacillus terrae]BBN99420.1 sporulation integral membrane protein YtvI [Sporolactobacillus terrae]
MNAQNSQPFLTIIFIVLRALVVIAITTSIIVMLMLAVRYALPFIIACALAFLINPLVLFIEKKTGLPRGAASFVVLFSFFSISIGSLLFIAFALIRGVASLSRTVPDELSVLIGDMQTFFFSRLVPSWEQAIHIFSGLPNGQQKVIQLNVESMAGTLVDMLNDLAGRLLTNLSQFVATIPSTLVSALFIFLASFFLSKDSERIKTHVHRLSMHSSIGRPVYKVLSELKKTCIGFVRAQFLLIFMTMALVFVGMLILKVPHPITITLITGVVDLIPYLGTGVIFIPWIIYQFFTHNYSFTICLTALYIAAIIQRQLMEPKIISVSIGIDPLASLVSIYFGFRWFGLAGLIIGPLVLVVIKTLYYSGTWMDLWQYILGKKSA